MEEYFQNKYSIIIDKEVTELNFGKVKKILLGVEKIIIDYPEIVEFINFIKITKFNFTHYDGNAIKLNQIYFYKESKSPIKYCNETSINGRWIKNSGKSHYIHLIPKLQF